MLHVMSEQPKSTYPGGFPAILAQMEGRRDPFSYHHDETLAPLDVDFTALKGQTMSAAAPELGESRSGYARKYRALAEEFQGQSALLHLHGLLVAHLRRRSQPAHTAALFQRLWAEEADYLLTSLDARWLVSAATTFGDHGVNELQRSVGHALSVLFGMMKLYETERLYSAVPPDQAHPWRKKSSKHLAMQMDAFAVGGAGGLDVNMLGRLWQQGSDDVVIAPLVQRLLGLLIEDDKTVFRRLHVMRARKARKNAAEQGVATRRVPQTERQKIIAPVPSKREYEHDGRAPQWGTVSLIKAETRDILRFAAYHLDRGAHQMHIYLDEPNKTAEEILARHPRIQLTVCDEAYWRRQKKPRMKTHRMRQVWVATQAYNTTECGWLAHIDVDEFLLPAPGLSIPNMLENVPGDQLGLLLHPAEQLASTGEDEGEAFKLTHFAVGQKRAVLNEIYPNFGSHLHGGFIGHTEGKLMLRTGLPGLRFGIHACHWEGGRVANLVSPQGSYLGHAHAPSWEVFQNHLEFRTTRGSYQKVEDNDRLHLGDVIDLLLQEGGQEALHRFYNEMNGGDARQLSTLASHGMLLDYPLHLDARVLRVFGNDAGNFL